LIHTDPYQTYLEGSLSSNPVRLVVALYEGAIDSVRRARTCFDQGDIWGRGQAVSRAVNILAELISSLDHNNGGELSENLKRLYDYMQRRLLEAHASKTKEPFDEVEKLLSDLLSAWVVVAQQSAAPQVVQERESPVSNAPAQPEEPLTYAGYLYEPVESFSRAAFTF
jgi:flagellar protein FliS